MSPPRRRSARLASGTTPKRGRASPSPQLTSLTERDESSEEQTTQSIDAMMSSPRPIPRTPMGPTSVKLPMSEMHPSKVHPTTAAPSSGLKLGFTDIEKSKHQAPGMNQTTPSKTPLPKSEFTFRHAGPNIDDTLGPEARRMMDELREEAARIKAELRTQEQSKQRESSDGRKIAPAKGRAGRFSAVHMAEFKKMDSIQGHPSAFRAVPGRITPMKAGIKRSQSKADLDERDSSRSMAAPPRPALKMPKQHHEEPEPSSKRVRQRLEDDASTLRPISRDGTSIPRPKSSGNDSIRSGFPRSQTHGNLMTPTKSSLAKSTASQTPTVTLVKSPSKPELGRLARSPSKPELGGLTRSPSKPELGGLARSPSKPDLASLVRTPSKKGFGGSLKKSATTSNLPTPADMPTRVQTPGRFDRVKSILKRQLSAKSKSGIPHLATPSSKTSSQQAATDKELPTAPLTTPGRKYDRHVDFTPETKRAAMAQESPSPVKSSLPRSKTLTKLPAPNFGKSTNSKGSAAGVQYPDLSAYNEDTNEDTNEDKPDDMKEGLNEAANGNKAKPLPPSVPGTFTFRSDHTIRFDSTSPSGFGGSSGQASLRHVREHAIPKFRMPGSFPSAGERSPNKENMAPGVGSGFPHGMTNKKRHRVSWEDEDDEEDEGSKRGAKKLRKDPPVAEGYALVAPRLMGMESPAKKANRSSHTPSPQKKSGGISLSRLNMLARPKVRK